jgi:hypothetical protein
MEPAVRFRHDDSLHAWRPSLARCSGHRATDPRRPRRKEVCQEGELSYAKYRGIATPGVSRVCRQAPRHWHAVATLALSLDLPRRPAGFPDLPSDMRGVRRRSDSPNRSKSERSSMTRRRFVIFGSISDDTSFVHFGMKSRLIRINERSAAGDPLEEFPKGNSLRRLEGRLLMSARRLRPPDIINRRRAV